MPYTTAQLTLFRIEYKGYMSEVRKFNPAIRFNDRVKAYLASKPVVSPDAYDYLNAARVIYNMTVPCSYCKQTRCPDGCCCSC